MPSAQELADYMRSWLPPRRRGCSGYDSACQCRGCQRRDRHLSVADADLHAEVLEMVRGEVPVRRPRSCFGYAYGCECPSCRDRADAEIRREALLLAAQQLRRNEEHEVMAAAIRLHIPLDQQAARKLIARYGDAIPVLERMAEAAARKAA